MSNLSTKSLNKEINHNLNLGDAMIKQYGKKQVKFNFIFNSNGNTLKKILEDSYREEIRNERILTGGVENVLQNSKN